MSETGVTRRGFMAAVMAALAVVPALSAEIPALPAPVLRRCSLAIRSSGDWISLGDILSVEITAQAGQPGVAKFRLFLAATDQSLARGFRYLLMNRQIREFRFEHAAEIWGCTGYIDALSITDMANRWCELEAVIRGAR